MIFFLTTMFFKILGSGFGELTRIWTDPDPQLCLLVRHSNKIKRNYLYFFSNMFELLSSDVFSK